MTVLQGIATAALVVIGWVQRVASPRKPFRPSVAVAERPPMRVIHGAKLIQVLKRQAVRC